MKLLGQASPIQDLNRMIQYAAHIIFVFEKKNGLCSLQRLNIDPIISHLKRYSFTS
jgi:hypothetical protein